MFDNELELVILKILYVLIVIVVFFFVKILFNLLNKYFKLIRCININVIDCESIFMYE